MLVNSSIFEMRQTMIDILPRLRNLLIAVLFTVSFLITDDNWWTKIGSAVFAVIYAISVLKPSKERNPPQDMVWFDSVGMLYVAAWYIVEGFSIMWLCAVTYFALGMFMQCFEDREQQNAEKLSKLNRILGYIQVAVVVSITAIIPCVFSSQLTGSKTIVYSMIVAVPLVNLMTRMRGKNRATLFCRGLDGVLDGVLILIAIEEIFNHQSLLRLILAIHLVVVCTIDLCRKSFYFAREKQQSFEHQQPVGDCHR